MANWQTSSLYNTATGILGVSASSSEEIMYLRGDASCNEAKRSQLRIQLKNHKVAVAYKKNPNVKVKKTAPSSKSHGKQGKKRCSYFHSSQKKEI